MSGVIWAAAFLLFFVVLPPLAVLLRMTSRRKPADFDENPAVMDHTPYEPWRQEILAAAKVFRKRPFERVGIQARDGVSLRGAWYPGGPKTALLIHGYSSTPVNNFAPLAERLLSEGWSVLMPDTRGHGESGGRVTFGLREAEDALRWAEWADARADCGAIMVCGISMGGAAVNLASDGPWPGKVRVLVSDAGYFSVLKQMETMPWKSAVLKWILIPGLTLFAAPVLGVSFREDGRKHLARARIPMCFLTGTADRSVLPETVEEAYAACGAEKKLIRAEGAPHTLAFLAGGEDVREELFGFIGQWMEPGETGRRAAGRNPDHTEPRDP